MMIRTVRTLARVLASTKLRHRTVDRRQFAGLYRIGPAGLLLYCYRYSLRPERLLMLRRSVVDDHASLTVAKALRRVVGIDLARESYTQRISPSRIICSAIWFTPALIAAYVRLMPWNLEQFAQLSRVARYLIAYRPAFDLVRPASVLIADTSDPKRIALGTLADLHDVSVATFCVPLMDPPERGGYRVETAFCWTREQTVIAAQWAQRSVRMPVPYRPLRTTLDGVESLRAGLLLNAKCNLHAVSRFLFELKNRYGLDKILVRPHPGYRVLRLRSLSHAEIADWREPIDRYLAELDLVFAPNTNASIDALLYGVPVVYVGGLDSLPYDFHGFVQRGLLLAYSDKLLLPDDVTRFFSASSFQSKWQETYFTTDGSEEHGALTSLLN